MNIKNIDGMHLKV